MSNIKDMKNELKKDVYYGAFALIVRKFVIKIINFGGNLVLLYLLDIRYFGLFAMLHIVASAAAFLGDMGLGMALVQKKEDITKDDIKTTFTVQFFIYLFFVVLIYFLSPLYADKFSDIKKLGDEGVLLIRVISVIIIINSLKIVPSAILERSLKFTRLVIPELLETVAYFGVAIVLAYKGFFIWSFIYAILFRSIVGVAVFFFLCPWVPSFGFSKECFYRLFTFGYPVWGTKVFSFAKDNINPVVVGYFVGATGVGVFNWIISITQITQVVRDVIARIVFPVFSRLQKDRKALTTTVEKAIKWGIIPSLFLGILSCIYLVPIIKYFYPTNVNNLLAGKETFWIFMISVILGSLTTVTFNIMLSMGKPKIMFKMMASWAILVWIAGVPLTYQYGYMGIAIAHAVTSFLMVYVSYKIALKEVSFNLFCHAEKYVAAAIISSIFSHFLFLPFATGRISLVVMILLSMTVYGTIYYLFDRKNIIEEYKDVKKYMT